MFHPLGVRDPVHVHECKECREHIALTGKTGQQLYDEFCASKPTYQWEPFGLDPEL